MAATTTTNAGGTASVRIAIPDDAAPRGSSAWAQAVVFDPIGSLAGLPMSSGLCLLRGD